MDNVGRLGKTRAVSAEKATQPQGEKMNTIASPLKWHGGKSYLAKRIIEIMPPHLTYCEPFAGGLSVMLAKDPEGVSEVANDINRGLVNFWEVLRDEYLFERFKRRIEAMPFSEADYKRAAEICGIAAFNPSSDQGKIALAADFFVCCRQSLAGRMESFAPLSRSRTRRGMNEQVSAWLSAVEGLPQVHARLKRVAVTNRPAVKVIKDVDHPEAFFYLDPTYLKETRTAPDVYQHEMNYADHEELLAVLASIKGKFILSGYQSPLYDTAQVEFGWHRIDIEIDNKAASGLTKRKMTECLWMNYKPEIGK